MFSRILFPQMMRFALPGIGNNWQVMVKATALVSIIGLADVVKAAAGCRQKHLQHVLLHPDRGADLPGHHHGVEPRADLAGKALFDRRAAGGALTDHDRDSFTQFWRAFLYWDGQRLSGLAITLWLLVASIGIGFCLSIPLAVARVSKKRWLSLPVRLYTYVFRGTPLYVQLLLIYTGMYSLEFVRSHRTARRVLPQRIPLRHPRLRAEHLRLHHGDFRRGDPFDLARRNRSGAGLWDVLVHPVPPHRAAVRAAPRLPLTATK